jgi:anti-anti-sigma regulatory factor
MNEAGERLELLAGELARQLKAEPKPARADIDLAGVVEVDACGCQLLALFFEKLKGHGIRPEPCGITPQLGETICLLGYAETFGTCGRQAKETR